MSRAWHWLRRDDDDVVIAAFPLAATLSAETAVQDEMLGPDIQRLLQDGELSGTICEFQIFSSAHCRGNGGAGPDA